MVLSRLTKITGPGVATDTNWVGNNADFTGITTTATSFNIGVTTIHSTLIEAHNIKSTGIITATGAHFSGNVSIAGTLTYEDVTNIDAVGIITAPALDVDDFLDVGSNIQLGNAGIITATSYRGDGSQLTGIGGSQNLFQTIAVSGQSNVVADSATDTLTLVAGSNMTITTNAGSDTITFASSGGSSTPAYTDVQVAYELTNSSSSGNGWRINGNGIVNTTGNPDLYLIRGQKYRFINNSGGSHPFRIQSDSSTSYDTGVTNNNSNSGNIDFVPRNDAPARLYYNCTNHGGMLGNIYLRGAGGHETNVGVTTFSGIVTNSAHPSFHVSRRGGDVSANNYVVFDQVFHNNGSHYNNSNGRFTAPVSGVYFFSAWNYTGGTSAFQLRINTTTYAEYTWDDTGGCGTWVCPMTSGQYAQIYTRSYTWRGTSDYHNAFCGYLIG